MNIDPDLTEKLIKLGYPFFQNFFLVFQIDSASFERETAAFMSTCGFQLNLKLV